MLWIHYGYSHHTETKSAENYVLWFVQYAKNIFLLLADYRGYKKIFRRWNIFYKLNSQNQIFGIYS